MSLDLETTVKQWIDADPESDLTAYLEVPADRPQRFVSLFCLYAGEKVSNRVNIL